MDFVFVLIRKVLRKIRTVFNRSRIRFLDSVKRERLPYYCPCCDTYLKSFIDVRYDCRPDIYNPERYAGIDQKVICPICYSLPRHRILVSWMDRNKTLIEGRQILHFAPEKALRLWMNRNHIKPVTADLYNPADLKLNIEDTGLQAGSYDVIICNHILEHVSDYRKALKELHRITRPGGMVIISFPVDPCYETVYESDRDMSEQERIRFFGQNDHLRVFGNDSPDILRSSGFDVAEIRGDESDRRIKPVIGPADYDYNVLWILKKQ